MAGELKITHEGDAATLYFIIRRHSDNKVWDVANTTWATWADGSIGDYDIAATSRGGDLYDADFPTGIVAGTRVLIFRYKQAGASPAITDLKLGPAQDAGWNGSTVASGSSVVLAANALTSLAAVKRWLKIADADTTWDTHITEYINAISDRLERDADRKFVAQDIVEWIDGGGERQLVLNNYPVIELNRIAYGLQNALTIRYSGAAIIATVQVMDDKVRLVSYDSSGVQTETDLAFTTYASVSALETAIDAVSGWTSTTDANGLSKHLRPTAAIDAKANLVQLESAEHDDDTYSLNVKTGLLTRRESSGWPDDFPGRFNRWYMVDYRAGFATIPADLETLATELVAEMFRRSTHDMTLTSESIGGYSYTVAAQLTNEDTYRSRVMRWCEIPIGGAG